MLPALWQTCMTRCMRQDAAVLQDLSKHMLAVLNATSDALKFGSGQGQLMETIVQANMLSRTCMLADVLPKVSHSVQLATTGEQIAGLLSA